MGTILALAAAVLYGSADFLGGAAARRARPLAVLAITAPAGAAIMVVSAVVASAAGVGGHATAGLGGSAGLAGVAWGAAAGIAGAAGLLTFYAGFSVAPMSVVAPISALASALLPLGVAIAQGERLSPAVIAGGVICLAAVALVSLERKTGGALGCRPAPGAGLRAGLGHHVRPVLPVLQVRRGRWRALAGGGGAAGGDTDRDRCVPGATGSPRVVRDGTRRAPDGARVWRDRRRQPTSVTCSRRGAACSGSRSSSPRCTRG